MYHEYTSTTIIIIFANHKIFKKKRFNRNKNIKLKKNSARMEQGITLV